MSEHSSHDISKHVKVYVYVFVALLIGTLLTVAVSYVDLGKGFNIALALLIASIKATLVGCYFMHLISERTTIYTILAFTAFFFIGLMFLTIWSFNDFPKMTTLY